MKKIQKSKFYYYGKIMWLFTKYQILTKILLFVVIFPFFKILTNYLISSSGRFSISSGDYLGFVFSIQGVAFLMLSFALITLLIAFDINAFIIISALIKENKIKLSVKALWIVGVKSLKLFIRPAGIFVMIYVAVLVPLVGIGLGVSVTQNFKIPNFITDVIFNNALYTVCYIIVILILTTITILYIFFFHYLIIDNQQIESALKKSSTLIKKHWKEFIKQFLFKSILLVFVLSIIIFSLFFTIIYYTESMDNLITRRFSKILVSVTVTEILAYLTLMTIPFVTYKLTDLFYQFNEKDGYKIKLKIDIKPEYLEKEYFGKVQLKTKVSLVIFIVLVMLFNFSTSILFVNYFDEIFRKNRDIDIVAHRGGGNLAAENSILGMEKAIEKGAKWSEIDVQRTKDGHYIINHDSTFSRLSNNNKSSSELTIDEINNLKIKDLFDNSRDVQPIPTLEQFLDESRGKIGLFIELKGNTADEKMVDDVINIVKSKGMEKDIAILSLDYKLIDYAESTYPEIDTGYLYFFSVGDVKNLKSDILIMEEQEATPEKLEEIHSVGKKAIVWTVNTDYSVEKFVLSDVDGIITDYVEKVRDGIITRDNRTDLEIIIDSIFN